MRSLEIVTAQNVTIDYNLASINERGLAFIIDLIFIGIIILLISIVQNSVLPVQYVKAGGTLSKGSVSHSLLSFQVFLFLLFML